MAAALPRLAIFGDSHYACLKQAHVQGLVDASGVEIEYWGHVGRRFHFLTFRDGAVHPTDDFTARRFAKFNEKGRLYLPAADFDVILVAGARTYVAQLLQSLLHSHCHGPFVSSGLRHRMITDRLRGQQGYRLAQELASTGTARVLLSPVALYTESPAARASVTPEMEAAGPEIRAALWDSLARIATEDGITMIPQPEETVSAAIFTSTDYAVADHLQKRDVEHHNAAYGALILGRALGLVRQEFGHG